MGKQRRSGRFQALDQCLGGAPQLHRLIRQGFGGVVDGANGLTRILGHIRNAADGPFQRPNT